MNILDSEAQWIVQALAARGMSDNAIARALRLHRISVLRIRHGDSSGSRSLDRLRALAYANGLSGYDASAGDPAERGEYATPRAYLDTHAVRLQFSADPEPPARPERTAPRQSRQPSPRRARPRGAARGSGARAARGAARGTTGRDATLLTQLTDILAPYTAQLQATAPQPEPARQSVTPTLPGFALTPALQATRSPLIICSVCGQTAPARTGYAALQQGATVYFCSRSCAQRQR